MNAIIKIWTTHIVTYLFHIHHILTEEILCTNKLPFRDTSTISYSVNPFFCVQSAIVSEKKVFCGPALMD